MVKGCKADQTLIQPVDWPSKPAKPVYGDLVNQWIEVRETVHLDNQKKAEFLTQWEKCQ